MARKTLNIGVTLKLTTLDRLDSYVSKSEHSRSSLIEKFVQEGLDNETNPLKQTLNLAHGKK